MAQVIFLTKFNPHAMIIVQDIRLFHFARFICIQWGAVIARSVFLRILTRDNPYLARKGGRCTVSFVSIYSDLGNSHHHCITVKSVMVYMMALK